MTHRGTDGACGSLRSTAKVDTPLMGEMPERTPKVGREWIVRTPSADQEASEYRKMVGMTEIRYLKAQQLWPRWRGRRASRWVVFPVPRHTDPGDTWPRIHYQLQHPQLRMGATNLFCSGRDLVVLLDCPLLAFAPARVELPHCN